MSKPQLMIVSTVPDTFKSVLKDQPQFLAQHFDVSILCGPPETPETAYDPIEVQAFEVKIRRAPDIIADLVSIWRVWRVMRQVRPDIVHSFSPKGGLVGMVAARLAGVPVRIHTFTGLIFPTSRGLKRQILEWVDSLIAWSATHVVPEGAGVRHDLQANRITRKPLPLINNGNIAGVDLEHFDSKNSAVLAKAIEQRKTWGVPKDDFVFGFVGRLSNDKGLSELTDAFIALNRPDVWLVCVGYPDARDPITEETRKALVEHPNVILAGYQTDIRPLLASFDTMVLPSYREGFPNVVLQAGAMAVPVVATDVNGSNEIVIHNKTGWLVPAKDSAALERAMTHACATGTDLKSIGQAGQCQIVQNYSQESYRAALLEYYESRLEEAKKA